MIQPYLIWAKCMHKNFSIILTYPKMEVDLFDGFSSTSIFRYLLANSQSHLILRFRLLNILSRTNFFIIYRSSERNKVSLQMHSTVFWS